MRFRLLLLAALFASLPASAQTLLFSEYAEGSSSNKAVEIFNPTASAVDLTAEGYTLELYSNGNAAPNATMPLVTAGSFDLIIPNP